MNSKILTILSILGAAGLALPAHADVANLSISGPGVSGNIAVTYDTNAPIASGGFAITNVTGTFSDTNADLGNPSNSLNIVNATVSGPVAVTVLPTLPSGVLATDFNTYAIANGVPSPPASQASPSLSFDNAFYPGGSPVVCTGYPASGGVLDIYGILFNLSNGDVVDLWSNGVFPGPPSPLTYGVAVADATNTHDYQSSVTVSVPEPSSLALLGVALGSLCLIRRRKALRPHVSPITA